MSVKSLNTLIKLQKRQIDVLRREISLLQDERNKLQEASEKLRQEYARESELLQNDLSMASFFATYSHCTKLRMATLGDEIFKLDGEIEAKTDIVREQFGEQKKYEIALQNAKKRIFEAEKHLLQKTFDEVASQSYFRNLE